MDVPDHGIRNMLGSKTYYQFMVSWVMMMIMTFSYYWLFYLEVCVSYTNKKLNFFY